MSNLLRKYAGFDLAPQLGPHEDKTPQGNQKAERALCRPREIRAWGMRFHPMPKADLLNCILNAARGRTRMIIAGANLHGLYVAHRDEDYRRLVERHETITIIDGMPVVWLLQALGYSIRRDDRTTWVDWFTDLLSGAAQDGLSVFVLGHDQNVLTAGLEAAVRLHPHLRIGGRPGYFDMENDAAVDAVIGEINGFAPDILIVGMGMPRQERFVHRFGSRLGAPVIGLGGAAFAYFAGHEPTPPRWMGRWGLEWLHRLFLDPRRMAWRYMVEPTILAYFLVKSTFLDQILRRAPALPRQ